MSRKEKREQRVRSNPANVSVEEFEALINQYGYIEEGSKHPKAVVGNNVFSFQRTNPIHRPYVDYLLDAIDKANKQTGAKHG